MTSAPRLKPDVLQFGPFRLDIDESRLTREGSPVPLRPKAFELLTALARSPRQLVTKEQLLDQVWGRRFITEGVIKSIVGELRSALADDPREPRWIETVPRRGYRFLVEVKPAQGSADAVVVTTAPSGTGNLPPGLPAPIGRDAALREASGLLDNHRLLTMAGPAGVGKTRFALALAGEQAGRFSDGAWLIELASLDSAVTDSSVLSATLVRALRLDPQACADVAGLVRAVRPLHMLLLFDNAEHLLQPLAALVEALLAGAPRLRILVTSQEPLRSPLERTCRVAPLTVPALHDASDEGDADRLLACSAVQLFVDQVTRRLPSFDLRGEAGPAVAAICRALDGMPLALELAAARVPTLGVQGLADLLLDDTSDARLKLLTLGSRTAVTRQRSLRDAIEWSYGLLDDAQQRVFRRLGVFAGSFVIDSAAQVAGDGLDHWQVIDLLDALVEKSLIEPVPRGGVPAFRLLQSLRAFAFDRLRLQAEIESTRDRHLAAAIRYWTEADEQALDTPALDWLGRHVHETDDLRAALAWAVKSGRHESLAQLVARSTMLWYRAGLANEGKAWRDAARQGLADDAPPELQRGLDLSLAVLTLYLNSYSPAEGLAAAQRAADSLDDQADARRRYFALHLLFQLSVHVQASFDRAALIARMAELEQPGWSDVVKRFLRAARAYDRRLSGDTEGYLQACRSEWRLCTRVGAVAERWTAAHGLMLAEHDVGRHDAAIDAGRAAIDEIRAAGRLRQYPTFLALWITMLAQSGAAADARAAIVEALPILHGAGTPWKASLALAWLALRDGDGEASAQLLGWHRGLADSGVSAGAGSFILRSTDRLVAQLAGQLEPNILDDQLARGRSLGWPAAERLATGRASDFH